MTQTNKALVRDYQAAVVSAKPSSTAETLSRYVAPDVVWHGPHPFNTQHDPDAITHTFWDPLKSAFPRLTLRPDILMGGTYQSGAWVCTMGHLAGPFARDLVGIPATGRLAFLRFGEYCRVENGKIAEIYAIYDLIGLMMQAGLQPLPASTGVEITIPGPATNDGLLYGDYDPDEGDKSRQLVEDMINIGLAGHAETDMSAAVHAQYWHDDMLWYGPSGIGSTFGIDGFKRDHQIPFRAALSDRRGGHAHKCRIGEGNYVASTGWPSYYATLSGGGWMGLPVTEQPITMRVMDFWRRDGDRLAENWVFIDLLDLFMQMKYDVLARMRHFNRK